MDVPAGLPCLLPPDARPSAPTWPPWWSWHRLCPPCALGPYPALPRAPAWLSCRDSPLAVLRGPGGVPRVEPGSVACRASALPAVQPLWPLFDPARGCPQGLGTRGAQRPLIAGANIRLPWGRRAGSVFPWGRGASAPSPGSGTLSDRSEGLGWGWICGQGWGWAWGSVQCGVGAHRQLEGSHLRGWPAVAGVAACVERRYIYHGERELINTPRSVQITPTALISFSISTSVAAPRACSRLAAGWIINFPRPSRAPVRAVH